MKRLFLIFLLVIVPFQLSWAGMGVYCQHETGEAAHHFGHHEHKHSDHQKDDPAKKLGGDDSDCCTHHGFVKAFLSSSLKLPELSHATGNSVPPIHLSSYIPKGLERPDIPRIV